MRLSLGVRAAWACSASKPRGQTLCPTGPHTHQQGSQEVSAHSCARGVQLPARGAAGCPGTPTPLPCQMGRIPQERPGRFQPPEGGSRSSALPLSSAGWLGWGASLCALTAWPSADGVHMAKTEWGRALSSPGGGGQEPAGHLPCCDSSFTLHASPGSR